MGVESWLTPGRRLATAQCTYAKGCVVCYWCPHPPTPGAAGGSSCCWGKPPDRAHGSGNSSSCDSSRPPTGPMAAATAAAAAAAAAPATALAVRQFSICSPPAQYPPTCAAGAVAAAGKQAGQRHPVVVRYEASAKIVVPNEWGSPAARQRGGGGLDGASIKCARAGDEWVHGVVGDSGPHPTPSHPAQSSEQAQGGTRACLPGSLASGSPSSRTARGLRRQTRAKQTAASL